MVVYSLNEYLTNPRWGWALLHEQDLNRVATLIDAFL